ncbi:MAG: 30S ribosomal protein S8e [Candidatus Ranarchaeia archaeon]
MSVFQGPPRRTKTSKKLKQFRKKKRFQMGRLPTETDLGERVLRKLKGRGNTIKLRLARDQFANVSDEKGVTKRLKIQKVLENPASVDYNRRGVITKGCIIKTELGKARVTSRPGSAGVISAVLIKE